MKLPPKAYRMIATHVRGLPGSERDAWNAWVDGGPDRDLTPRAAGIALRVVRDLAKHARDDLKRIADHESDPYVLAANDAAYLEMLVRALNREQVAA